jgi:hypothetical protein
MHAWGSAMRMGRPSPSPTHRPACVTPRGRAALRGLAWRAPVVGVIGAAWQIATRGPACRRVARRSAPAPPVPPWVHEKDVERWAWLVEAIRR